MRKNRKIPKRMSVVAANTMRFGAIVVFLFVMVILNLLASSSCTQLMKAKGEKERKLAQLDEARERESSRWEGMQTPEKVARALTLHGLVMNLPRAEQNIRLRPDGTPFPGQLSMSRAKRRMGAVAATSSAVPASTAARRRRRVH